MVASKKTSPESSDDSEDDDYGRKSTTRSRKRQKVADFEQRAVRFTSRRAAKVVSYNESEDDFSEEIEEVVDSYYMEEAEAEIGIDQVLDFRFKEDGKYEDIKTDAELKERLEFYIKWQGQSHYHATWETFAPLVGRKGFRKLENFLKKVKVDFARRMDPSTTPEDIAQMDIEQVNRRSVIEGTELWRESSRTRRKTTRNHICSSANNICFSVPG
jgi:chromodomain-helicase-DNA-binding protein 1